MQECITINDKKFCAEAVEIQAGVRVGNQVLRVSDPIALLNKAKQTQISRFKKTGLWDYYEYPPFIMELARQNDMEPGYMITLLAAEDIDPNPWRSLVEVAEVYEATVLTYGHVAATEVFNKIMDEIIEDILEQIHLTVEHEHV